MKNALLILLAATSLVACNKRNDIYPEYGGDTGRGTTKESTPPDNAPGGKTGLPPKQHMEG